MEAMKKNWPMLGCSALIVATMVGCSCYLAATIRRYSPDSPGQELWAIQKQLESIDEHLKNMDERSMSAGEYLQKHMILPSR